MIVQVAPDSRQVMEGLDTERAQPIGVADAGALQDDRRTEGTAREHDSPALDALASSCANVLDARGASAFKQDA
jgi:hypothetical protein